MRCVRRSSTVGGVGPVFVFSLTAALNPTLLTAVTLMLTLSHPERLLLGYLLGALVTSITCGLVIVFALSESSASNTAKRTVDPIVDIVLGSLLLLVVIVVGTGRDQRRRAWSERRRERRRERALSKPPPRWKRQLSKGSARDTFVVGVLLSFPGASYIAGMDGLSKQHLSTFVTVLAVLAFNLIMLVLLELPLLGYATRPEWTAAAVTRFSAWVSRRGGRVILFLAGAISLILIARGTLSLL
jgi:Sap, sulfolipid-1-addressing protein